MTDKPMTTACECGEDIWCQVCAACRKHCFSNREEACREIRRLREEVALTFDSMVEHREAETAEYRRIKEGHETLMQEALEELERCSPNAPVVDKLRARLKEKS